MDNKVSVILPTFNGASRGYLAEAIESVLAQSYKNYELIIVDDGSMDETKDLCKKYITKPNVKYIYQENKGLVVARNQGLINGSGSFICFLDDDDVWKPQKIQKQLDFFLNNSDSKIGMVYTAADYIDEDGKSLGIRYKAANGNIYKRLIFEGNIITCPSSVMIKKEVFDTVGILNEEMKSLEDLELWLRISKYFHICSINEDLVKYRIHFNRITAQSYRREEFYEYLLYYWLLQGVKNIDEDLVYRNLYQRFAIRHFSLGNYKAIRKFYTIASAYGSPSVYMRLLCLLSYFPWASNIFKRIRRRIKKYLYFK